MTARLIGTVQNYKILQKLYKLDEATKKRIHHALFEIGQEGVQHIRDLMSEKKSGKIYNIKGLDHQASAPGEAPAILSRKLFRSIDYRVRGYQQVEWFSDLNELYPFYLERGTTKMDPRPFLKKPTLSRRKENINAIVRYALGEQ